MSFKQYTFTRKTVPTPHIITNPWLVMACSCYARLRAEDFYMTNVGNVTKYLKQILLHLNWRQYISGNKGNVGK